MCAVVCVRLRVSHQSHVIRQYSPTHPLGYFFDRETCEGVVVQLSSLLPEGRQGRFVFSSAHPGQRLPLVGQERSAHGLKHVHSKAAIRTTLIQKRGSADKDGLKKNRHTSDATHLSSFFLSVFTLHQAIEQVVKGILQLREKSGFTFI